MRHIYLYAKGHYKESSNIFEDLQKIISYETGIDFEYASSKINVFEVVVDLTVDQVKRFANPSYWFKSFIYNIHPSHWWKIGMKDCEYVDRVPEIIIRNCLSILRMTEISLINGELGEPNPEILPLEEKHSPQVLLSSDQEERT